MDTLLKNNIEGIILKWSYQVQIMNKSPFGGKLVHWRGCLHCLLIESLKTKCWKAIFLQTDEVLGKDSAEELNKGNNPGDTKQSLPKRSKHQTYICVYLWTKGTTQVRVLTRRISNIDTIDALGDAILTTLTTILTKILTKILTTARSMLTMLTNLCQIPKTLLADWVSFQHRSKRC